MNARPILICCPKTKRLFPTGIAADKASYESGTFSNNSSQCPHCGKPHVWSKENTILGDDMDTIKNN